jgi:hypothetical protein
LKNLAFEVFACAEEIDNLERAPTSFLGFAKYPLSVVDLL